jgi:hypothetical protein
MGINYDIACFLASVSHFSKNSTIERTYGEIKWEIKRKVIYKNNSVKYLKRSIYKYIICFYL